MGFAAKKGGGVYADVIKPTNIMNRGDEKSVGGAYKYFEELYINLIKKNLSEVCWNVRGCRELKTKSEELLRKDDVLEALWLRDDEMETEEREEQSRVRWVEINAV